MKTINPNWCVFIGSMVAIISLTIYFMMESGVIR